MPARCLSTDVEKAVGMTNLQYREKVRAGILGVWAILNEPS